MEDIVEGLKEVEQIIGGTRTPNEAGQKNAEMIAEGLLRRIFNVQNWREATQAYVRPMLESLILVGAIDEIAVHNIVLPGSEALLAERSLSWGPMWQWRLGGMETSPRFPMESPQSSLLNNVLAKQTSAAEFLREIGLDPPPGVAVELPIWLRERLEFSATQLMAADYWDHLTETTRADMLNVLTVGVTEGRSIRQIRMEIEARIPGYSRARAELVARTECLPGSAVVNGAVINAGYKRSYSGPMVEVVTEAGRKFTGTPNHPVLTLRGWVGLGDLTEEDRLVCDGSYIEKFRAAGDQDVKHPPPTISQVFDSLSAVSVSVRSRSGKPDFHGDGMDGYVDIQRPLGPLRLGGYARLREGSFQDVLESSDEISRLVLAANGNSFRRDLFVSQSAGLLDCADLATGSLDRSADAGFRNSKLTSQVNRAFAGLVAAANFGRVQFGRPASISRGKQFLPGFRARADDAGFRAEITDGRGVATETLGDFDCTKPGPVQLDRVRSLRFIECWHGDVFNFSTPDGYFVADGVYTGNTTGALNSGHQEVMEQIAEETQGALAGKSWLSLIDERTRATHLAADGQIRRVSEPFTVGGFPAMYPGDPALPVEQRANCVFPGQLIEGRFDAAMRVRYEGVATKIVFASGRGLTLTPNHYVVTADGLVLAGELRPGQEVLANKFPLDSPFSSRARSDYEDHEPSFVEQVFETLSRVRSGEVVSTKMDDFDGDAAFFESNVEVVGANSELLLNRKAFGGEDGGSDSFSTEDASGSLLASDGSGDFLRQRVLSPAGGGVGLLCTPKTLLGRHLSHTDDVGFGRAANWNVSLAESKDQDGSGVAGFLRECQERLAGDVLFDKIIEVRDVDACGHVYDFQSSSDCGANVARGYFLCNGIFVRNCRCTTISSTISRNLV